MKTTKPLITALLLSTIQEVQAVCDVHSINMYKDAACTQEDNWMKFDVTKVGTEGACSSNFGYPSVLTCSDGGFNYVTYADPACKLKQFTINGNYDECVENSMFGEKIYFKTSKKGDYQKVEKVTIEPAK